MRLRITFLKAPWPPGAAVGDVIELDCPAIPGWAVGKCEPTDEAVTLTHGTATGDGSGVAAPEFVANVPADDIQAQAAHEAAALDARQALIERAKARGLAVDGRWSDKRLAQEVAKAEAA